MFCNAGVSTDIYIRVLTAEMFSWLLREVLRRLQVEDPCSQLTLLQYMSGMHKYSLQSAVKLGYTSLCCTSCWFMTPVSVSTAGSWTLDSRCNCKSRNLFMKPVADNFQKDFHIRCFIATNSILQAIQCNWHFHQWKFYTYFLYLVP